MSDPYQPDPYQGRHQAGPERTEHTPGPTSPVTGPAAQAAARAAYEDAPKGHADQPTEGDPVDDTTPAPASPDDPAPAEAAAPVDDSPEALAAAFELETSAREGELLDQLQRVNAEYTNYRRRVDRDRDVEKSRAIAGVIEALLPVLDEIHLARQHGELSEGPFAKIADKLETILARYGVERFGDVGEPFDPMVHQAITHTQTQLPEGTTVTTVIQVMQPGYRMGEKVVRPAFVAVADPA